jgi:hypothetical protein
MHPISSGQFVKLYCDWLEKPKYFLVAASDDIPLLLYISTNKPAFCQTNHLIDADFLLLSHIQYQFLDYDSWLDCGDVCLRFLWPSIEYQLRQGLGWGCGQIRSDTRKKVVELIGNSVRLSTKNQRIMSEHLNMG